MPLAYVFDEHLRGGPLWQAVQTHNGAGLDPIDVTRVGDPPDLPLRMPDPGVLEWAEANGRVLVSRDLRTLPGHLMDHLAAGRHSPGVFLIIPGALLAPLIAFLVEAAIRSDPKTWVDRIEYIP